MGKVNKKKLDARYEVIAGRHAGWDVLLWQIPALMVAAQSFLLVIALAPDSTLPARIVACSASIGFLLLSAISMARQRQTAILDAQRLAQMERDAGIEDEDLQFGPEWRDRRNNTTIGVSWLEWLRIGRSRANKKEPKTIFLVWIVAFGAIAALDLLIIAAGLFWPVVWSK